MNSETLPVRRVIRPLELYIGLRYTRAKRRNRFISFISLTSMLGIALGVAALIVVLSVMNGFGKELRERILGVVSHVTITEGWSGVRDWEAVAKRLEVAPEVAGIAPYVELRGLLIHGARASGVLIRGVVPEREQSVSALASHVSPPGLESLGRGSANVVLGASLAESLGLSMGDSVTFLVQRRAGDAGPPVVRRFVVSGLLRLGMHQYDNAMALIPLDAARIMSGSPHEVTGLRIRLHTPDAAPVTGERLTQMLGSRFRARDWTRENRNFFIALKDQKRILFIVLMLIVAVAAFNIVSTLIMMVTDKRGDIAILRTLGLSPMSVMGVFMIQGSLIALLGVLTGAVTGILIANNVEAIVKAIESVAGFTFLAADVYPITDLPSDIRWQDIALITGSTLGLGVGATIYPAWRASNVQPAEVLRYE
jgi:lipoprotein-releasing system permease protein